MTLDQIRDILMWSAVINFGLLIWWFIFVSFAHNWTYKLHSRIFDISRHRFDSVHYSGMMAYKLAIFLFNLAPYLAILIIQSE